MHCFANLVGFGGFEIDNLAANCALDF